MAVITGRSTIATKEPRGMGLFSFLKRSVTKRIGAEHRQFYELSGEILGGTHALCPRCRRGRLVAHGDDAAVRVCDDPACGHAVPLETLARTYAVVGSDPAAIVARERRHAGHLFLGAQVFVAVAAGWAVWTDSWATLLGASVLGFLICAFATVARYRAWQIEHGRLFEARAPFSAYLRWEVGGVLGHRRA